MTRTLLYTITALVVAAGCGSDTPSQTVEPAQPAERVTPAPGDDHAAHEKGHEDHDATEGHEDGQDAEATAAYACPMHPDVTSKTEGACPKCGMALEKQAEHDHAAHDHGDQDRSKRVPAEHDGHEH